MFEVCHFFYILTLSQFIRIRPNPHIQVGRISQLSFIFRDYLLLRCRCLTHEVRRSGIRCQIPLKMSQSTANLKTLTKEYLVDIYK